MKKAMRQKASKYSSLKFCGKKIQEMEDIQNALAASLLSGKPLPTPGLKRSFHDDSPSVSLQLRIVETATFTWWQP